jgi:hypothetical protein
MGPAGWVLALAAVTSPWVVMNGLIVGYYDHLVDLCVLGAAALIGTRRSGWAAALVCIGVLTHELTLWMVPTLATLIWLTSPRPGRDLLTFLAPVVVTGAAVAFAAHTITQPQIMAVVQGIQRWGLLDPTSAQMAVSHLQAHHAARYLAPARAALPSLLRADIGLVTFPLVGLLLAAASAWVGRRAWVLPFAALAPLSLYTVATDTARIAYTTLFLSALILAKVAKWPAPERPVFARFLTVGGLAVLALNLTADVPLMARVEAGEGPAWPRSAPTRSTFSTCRPAFENAGFEAGDLGGWTATGGFRTERALRKSGRIRGTVEDRWASSGPPGSTGTLSSPTFTLEDTLLLSVAGGDDEAVVELEVDGVVVASARGENTGSLTTAAWDTSAWRGREARVVATDDSKETTLGLDGLCWFGAALGGPGGDRGRGP